MTEECRRLIVESVSDRKAIDRKKGVVKRKLHHDRVRRKTIVARCGAVRTRFLSPLEPKRRRRYKRPPSSTDIQRVVEASFEDVPSARAIRRVAEPFGHVPRLTRKAAKERERQRLLSIAAENGGW